MVHRISAESTDDFAMLHVVDALGPIAHKRVLVVDDYPAGADALKLLLEQDGFEVRSACDACAACSIAQKWLPFAVIVDIAMPGISGLELARQLRAAALTRHMLLIAFTARGSSEDITQACEAGFDVHWLKPLTPVRLLAVLRFVTGK
jgi:two-component system OmpR family response regulator